MLDLIVWRRGQSLDRLRLDAVDLGLDLRNFLQRLRREYFAALFRARRICAQRGGDYGSRNIGRWTGVTWLLADVTIHQLRRVSARMPSPNEIASVRRWPKFSRAGLPQPA